MYLKTSNPTTKKLFIGSESDNGVDMQNSDLETQLPEQHFHILNCLYK